MGTSTTVRINNNPNIDVPNESLESNITIVTTTHPPVLHQCVDNDDSLINHGRLSSSQVVIISNENNKTQVSRGRTHVCSFKSECRLNKLMHCRLTILLMMKVQQRY